MRMEEWLLDQLGVYFTYHNINQRFGLTFEKYCGMYINNPLKCTVAYLATAGK